MNQQPKFDKKINCIGDIYLKYNLNVLNNAYITNFLRVYDILGLEEIKIDNFCVIDKNLNLQQSINWTQNKDKYSLLKLSNINNKENNFIIEKNLNIYYQSEFLNLISKKNTNFYISTTFPQFITFAKNINISQQLTSDINKLNNSTNIYTDTDIGYFYSKNMIVHGNSITKNSDVLNTFVYNINTNNLDVLNNCNSILNNINIKNTLNVLQNTNVIGDLNISNNLNVHKFLDFKNTNSLLILPNNLYNYNITGALRHNDIKHTIEAYYNNKWKSISHLYSSDYSTSILTQENDDITVTQNNNLVIEFNNITNNCNIFKDTVILNNLNIHNISNFKKNLNISQNLNSSNIFINGLLELPIKSNNQCYNGLLRYNNHLNYIQLYSTLNKGWSSINFNNNTNGIIITPNDTLNLYLPNNKFTLNSNISQFHKNVNISKNVNINKSLIVTNNFNVQNIFINNKAKLEFFNNKLNAFISPNYNNQNYSNYLSLDVNDTITDNYYNIPYFSDIFFNFVNFSNYTYSTIEYNLDPNLLVNYRNSFIYHSSNNNNCIVNSFEINYFINNTTINELSTLNLIDLKKSFYVLIYYNDKLIYNSESNNTYFILPKNIYFSIQIKLKNISNNNNSIFSNNLNNILLFFRFKGFYYSDLVFNHNQCDFIYRIDNDFKNDITFLNDLTTYKKNVFNNLNINQFYINKLHINHNNIVSNNILQVNDIDKNPCFTINNNKILFGNVSKSQLLNNSKIYIKNKFNNDSLYIKGNSIINKNIYVLNNFNISNNCITSNINYSNLNINNIIYNKNTIFNTNLNIDNLNSYNLNLNSNKLLDNTLISNLIYNNNINSLNDLTNNNIIISNNKINFKNSFCFNIEGNLSINSKKCFNAFSIGYKTNPNISISHNGDTNVKCQNNGFYLNNINILYELNLLNNTLV